MRIATWALIIVLFVGGSWWLYTHSSSRSVPTSGDVTQQIDIDGNPIPSEKTVAPAVPAPSTVSAATAPTAPATTSPATTTSTSPVAAPVSDTLDRNAPAGMAFGGSGRYQWYRQGNLTWRIDTRSGTTCVDFATMDEWQKPIVYSNGCRFRT